MKLDVKIDAAKGSDAFKQIRREVGKAAKADMKAAVEEIALPVAKRMAPGRVAQLTKAGATTKSAYLEVERRTAKTRRLFPGPKGGDTPSLLYFGGQRRDIIRAKGRSKRGRHAAALRVGPGVYRAAVVKPRRYRANPFLDRAAAVTRDKVAARINRDLEARIRRVPGVK